MAYNACVYCYSFLTSTARVHCSLVPGGAFLFKPPSTQRSTHRARVQTSSTIYIESHSPSAQRVFRLPYYMRRHVLLDRLPKDGPALCYDTIEVARNAHNPRRFELAKTTYNDACVEDKWVSKVTTWSVS